MKSLMTPNLIKFAVATIILTILFRLGLSTSITNKMTITVILSAISYAILMWINGRYFGRKESRYQSVYDIKIRLHLLAFIVHNIVSILWYVFEFKSKHEHINVIYIIALIWSIFLIIHFIYYRSFRKSSIRNLVK